MCIISWTGIHAMFFEKLFFTFVYSCFITFPIVECAIATCGVSLARRTSCKTGRTLISDFRNVNYTDFVIDQLCIYLRRQLEMHINGEIQRNCSAIYQIVPPERSLCPTCM